MNPLTHYTSNDFHHLYFSFPVIWCTFLYIPTSILIFIKAAALRLFSPVSDVIRKRFCANMAEFCDGNGVDGVFLRTRQAGSTIAGTDKTSPILCPLKHRRTRILCPHSFRNNLKVKGCFLGERKITRTNRTLT